MIHFEINNADGKFVFHLPSNLAEITSEYLTNVTSNIEVAKNYSLIALCHRDKLANVIISVRQKKTQLNTSVVPMFVKTSDCSSTSLNNLTTGQTIIVAPSQLALGHHAVASKNNATISKFISAIADDPDVYKTAMSHTESVYFIEFKIIPNCDIIGAYTLSDIDSKFDNPFKLEQIYGEL